MDYKKIMDGEEFSYNKLYEKSVTNIEDEFSLDSEIKEKLLEKRKFGIEKYKEYSFQASLENSMKVPTLLHAEEEMVDLLNYLLHEYFKNSVRCDEKSLNSIAKLIEEAYNLYCHLKEHI